jgi:hypothetical protein
VDEDTKAIMKDGGHVFGAKKRCVRSARKGGDFTMLKCICA